MGKRLPKSKSGRILVAIREKIINAPYVKGEVLQKRAVAVENLNKRIQYRLIKEDEESSKRNQLMMTDYRTTIEYMDGSTLIRAIFTGTISEAQKTLQLQRRRESIKGPFPIMHWAHFTKGHEILMGGMWLDAEIVKA